MSRADDARDDWYDDIDPADDVSNDDSRRRGPLALVRPADVRVALIAPRSFEDAQTIADHLRDDAVVLVDLRGCDPRLAGRLTDFCSGLAYAIDGSLQDVAVDVVLVTPDHVDVCGEAASGVRPPGFFNRV